ncbi:hypothetical protein L349_04924 [Enterobacter sp. MGH 3]|nr:hypothetical protein L349_04924 [Enterobacter sp. MGH 3]
MVGGSVWFFFVQWLVCLAGGCCLVVLVAEEFGFGLTVEWVESGVSSAGYFLGLGPGWVVIFAAHHKVFQHALSGVLDGEIQRLLLVVARVSTRAEVVTILVLGGGLVVQCGAGFVDVSSSQHLFVLSCSTGGGMLTFPVCQSMWPMALRDDADSKAMWWTGLCGCVCVW